MSEPADMTLPERLCQKGPSGLLVTNDELTRLVKSWRSLQAKGVGSPSVLVALQAEAKRRGMTI